MNGAAVFVHMVALFTSVRINADWLISRSEKHYALVFCCVFGVSECCAWLFTQN